MTVFLFSIVMVRTLLREAGANLVTSYQLPVTSKVSTIGPFWSGNQGMVSVVACHFPPGAKRLFPLYFLRYCSVFHWQPQPYTEGFSGRTPVCEINSMNDAKIRQIEVEWPRCGNTP